MEVDVDCERSWKVLRGAVRRVLQEKVNWLREIQEEGGEEGYDGDEEEEDREEDGGDYGYEGDEEKEEEEDGEWKWGGGLD